MIASPGQAEAGLRSAVSCTHGGALHRTETDWFCVAAGGQSPVAVATMGKLTDWPAVQAGMTTWRDQLAVAPGWTS